ncbi:MAG: GNAT family N-acetyltransferase [Bacteroidota bacterium]
MSGSGIVPPEHFDTKRLHLRRPTPADAADVFEYASDPEVTRYLGFPTHRSLETSEGFLRSLPPPGPDSDRFAWAITLLGSDRLIGVVEIRIRATRADVGYVLTRRCWGQGYMTEAVSPIVEWAREQGSIHRVWATCDVENRASARVLEKVGMQREGILRQWEVNPNMGNAARDHYCYSIVRS